MFDKDRRVLCGPRRELRVVVAVADPFIDGLFKCLEFVKVPRLMCSLVISANPARRDRARSRKLMPMALAMLRTLERVAAGRRSSSDFSTTFSSIPADMDFLPGAWGDPP